MINEGSLLRTSAVVVFFEQIDLHGQLPHLALEAAIAAPLILQRGLGDLLGQLARSNWPSHRVISWPERRCLRWASSG